MLGGRNWACTAAGSVNSRSSGRIHEAEIRPRRRWWMKCDWRKTALWAAHPAENNSIVFILKPPPTTKPDVAVGNGGEAIEAIGATRAAGIAVPMATPQDTVIPGGRAARIGATRIRRPIPIPTPLEHIPSHVVES